VPHKDACLLSDEQARQTLGFCFPEVLFRNRELSERADLEIMELLTSFNSFVTKMKEMAK